MLQLFRWLIPYRGRVVLMLVLLFLQVMGTLYIPTLTANIVNSGIIPGNLELVWQIGLQMLLVAVLTAGIAISGTFLSADIAALLGRDLRNALFKKTQALSLTEFQQFGTASLITRCTSDITQVQQAFTACAQMLLPAPIMMIAGLMLAFGKDPFLALTIIGAMLLIGIFAVLLGKRVIPLFEKLQLLLDQINRLMRENLSGIRVIRAFSRADYEKKRLDQTVSTYAATAIRANQLFAALLPIIMIIMDLCTVAILWFGGQRVATGGMQIGDIMALIEYAAMILLYCIMGLMIIMMIPRAQICAQRINQVLQVQADEAETVLPAQLEQPTSSSKLEFRHVTFQYAGAEEPVLNDISFTAHSGQTLAIIGGTGSGKSTLASLIPRFYEIQSGSILLNDVDISTMPLPNLRAQIGFVSQKVFLFSGTIADNFRHGKPDASLVEMEHAAKIAQIQDFIHEQPAGFDTTVAQGGTNFSGGQKQRLSIARAMIKKPQIFVFDDSFSALDFKTDACLRAALLPETREAIVILVAQRISSIMQADQIIVLDEGNIVGMGDHQTLLAQCPHYQQIAQSQLSQSQFGKEALT